MSTAAAIKSFHHYLTPLRRLWYYPRCIYDRHYPTAMSGSVEGGAMVLNREPGRMSVPDPGDCSEGCDWYVSS